MNNNSAIDAAEAELQQELREMFEIDTQQHLETYFRLIQQLNSQSWTADIQHLYRAIHTVKGGAVTVAADAMLPAAMVLEDLLSDLRYLETAPILANGELIQILLEAGELLSSSVEIVETGARAIEIVQPTVDRLTDLRDRVKQLYLPDWNELKQVHYEFAEQGFDLVILDLEIALSKIPDRGIVPAQTIDTAQATISQLAQIGIDLELNHDWTGVLQYCEELIQQPDCQLWTSIWSEYFQLLKTCAKNSGKITISEIEELDKLSIVVGSSNLDLELLTSEFNHDLSGSLDIFFLDEADELSSVPEVNEFTTDLDREFKPAVGSEADQPQDKTGNLLANLPNLLDDFFGDFQIELAPAEPSVPDQIDTLKNPVELFKRSIQIPVPLERLDRSAQQVVDTLLNARTVMSVSHQLKSQLDRLTVLTRENAQFVTRLRQLQDDYALLRNLSDEQKDPANNVPIERYRQGYTTIVHLLENVLRLAELGQEIETSTNQNSTCLEALDRSILQLKDGIETSRLVPFRNLTLRSKAILRDLTNRYGKPAELIVINEQIELDAGIMQQLEPALLHLLRNAYDHGLESIPYRLTAGKPAQGKIQISLHQQGNIYRLTIEDDGGGIDGELIHQMAKSKGFALNQTRTNAELLAVLCQPGFSSNHNVTEVSGRGVGMDVVVAQIASVGGSLSLKTQLGRGSKFSIEIPAPQLLIPCVLFQVGTRIIGIPTDHILETALLDMMTSTPIDPISASALGRCSLMLANHNGKLPAFDLNNYWQDRNFDRHRSSSRLFPDTAVCIRTQQATDTPEIWSIADDLLGQAKLLISPLPSPLIAPVGLLGVSLQPDGQLISILDPIALTTMITSTSTQSATDEGIAPHLDDRHSSKLVPIAAPTILIVDDAAMIRHRIQASLNTYGFITHTCNDGLEALHWLQNNPHPDLMITDLEMPNMDGFTLIDRVRQAQIKLPILVVSSRSTEEWGKEARRLGATDYLNKGFATSELLEKVNFLLAVS